MTAPIHQLRWFVKDICEPSHINRARIILAEMITTHLGYLLKTCKIQSSHQHLRPRRLVLRSHRIESNTEEQSSVKNLRRWALLHMSRATSRRSRRYNRFVFTGALKWWTTANNCSSLILVSRKGRKILCPHKECPAYGMPYSAV